LLRRRAGSRSAPSEHRLGGVADQVPDHLAQLAGGRVDDHARAQVAGDADLLAPLLPKRAHDLGDLFGEVERPPVLAARARVVEQIGDEAVQAVDLAHADVHQLAAVASAPGVA